MRGGKIFRFCYLLTLAILVISGGALALRLTELRRGDTFYAQAGGTGETAPLPAAPAEELEDEAPEVPELSARLSQFAKTYPEAAAWLQIPDTPLDYPVMLGTDNRFYLDHLPDGSRNDLGSLFLDYRTCADSVHLIVYGHNGAGGKMFGLLKQYESPDCFSEHPALTLAVAERVVVCPIFSVRRVEAGGDAYRLEFEEDGSLQDYIRRAAAESLYPIEADGEAAAGVVTLSTCTGWGNQRLIVQALLPE